jgi:hypothetical protein
MAEKLSHQLEKSLQQGTKLVLEDNEKTGSPTNTLIL